METIGRSKELIGLKRAKALNAFFFANLAKKQSKSPQDQTRVSTYTIE